MIQQSFEQLIQSLAAKTPTPGGGAAVDAVEQRAGEAGDLAVGAPLTVDLGVN